MYFPINWVKVGKNQNYKSFILFFADFYERWPKHLHTINSKSQSNDQVYSLLSSNLKMLCNLRNWTAKQVYLCNVIAECCFSIRRKSFSFRFAIWDNFTSTWEGIIATYYKCMIGLKIIFGHKFILKCDISHCSDID